MKSYSKVQLFGLNKGPILSIIILLLPVPDGMSKVAWYTTAVAISMAVYWLTEAIPIVLFVKAMQSKVQIVEYSK